MYTGQIDKYGYDLFLAEVDLDEKASPPQIRCSDLKTKAMVLKKIDELLNVVEFGKNKLLVDNLVVD